MPGDSVDIGPGGTPERAPAPLLAPLGDPAIEPLVTCDAGAVVRDASAVVGAITGYGRSELIGRHVLHFVHPEDAGSVSAAIAALAGGRSQVLELRLRDRDGAARAVEALARPALTGGAFAGFTAVLRSRPPGSAATTPPPGLTAPLDRDGYCETNLAGETVLMTPQYYALFGFTDEEVAEVEVASADRTARFIAIACGKVADREAYVRSTRDISERSERFALADLELRDGRVLERYTAPRRSADGAVVGRAVFLRDVTARRRVEVELRDRARQQQLVVELGELALHAVEPAPLLLTATKVVAEGLGVELVHLVEVAPEAQTMRIVASNADAGLGAGPFPLAGTISAEVLRTRDTVTIPDLPADPRFPSTVLGAAGAVSGVAAMVRAREQPFGILSAHARRRRIFTADEKRFVETVANLLAATLARHAAERALRDRERQLRAIFESTRDALTTFDGAGRLHDVNPSACRLFGVSREELLGGMPIPLAPASRERVPDWRQELRDHGHCEGEVQLLPPGSPPRQVEFTAAGDILPGLHLLVMRDVTEERALQVRVAIADRMASVGTLAAGVAHELNNPLAYVAANLAWIGEHLREGCGSGQPPVSPGELVEAITEASEGAERMRHIIRDLGTLSRADVPSSGPVELEPLLDSCVSMAWNEIRHRARLDRQRGDVPPVQAHAARLGQVFLNLLVNASQSLPDGHAGEHRIRVATRRWPDGRVAVEVADTGCGIAPEHRARIFDPFFTTKAPGVGTGLGLSICHNLLHAMGGEIEVESVVGAGSLFRVLLHPAGGAVGAADRPAPDPREQARRRARVLVVDDEPLVGGAIRRALATEHDVTLVGSGREALEAIGQHGPFDLVVSDLLMPEMTGIELQRALAEKAPALAARTVFVTGGAFTAASRDFVEAHRDACLEKPFKLDDLRSLVHRRLAAAA